MPLDTSRERRLLSPTYVRNRSKLGNYMETVGIPFLTVDNLRLKGIPMPDEPLWEAQQNYYEDLNRQRGQKGLLLELLLDGKWHENGQCASVGGLSFNDSLFCLRNEGWEIESRHVRRGTWELRLLGKSKPREGHKRMTRPQKVIAKHYFEAARSTLDQDVFETMIAQVPGWARIDRPDDGLESAVAQV